MEAPGGSWGLVWTGFGRLFAEGENRKMVRKWLRTHQKSLKNYQIVEQAMADPIFGFPGPGGGPKRQKIIPVRPYLGVGSLGKQHQ